LAGGPPISGTISRTADAIDPKARTFRAELDIPNADGRLVSGLYVRVAFQLENNGMSRVPAATLVFSPTGPTVAVVSADNTVRFRAVTIGRDDGEQVELSTGVSDGDRLVLNISNQIAEGDKVQVVAQDGAPAPSVAMRAQP